MKRILIPTIGCLLSLVPLSPSAAAEPVEDPGGVQSYEESPPLPPQEESSTLAVGVGYRSPADTRAPWRAFPYADLTGGITSVVKGSRVSERGIFDLSLDYATDREYLVTFSADRAARYRLDGTLESFRRSVTHPEYGWDPFSLWSIPFARETGGVRDHASLTLRQNEVTTRVKPFDYPFHIDLAARSFDRSGTSFLRFADVHFTGEPNTLYLRERSFDRRVTEVRGGIDAHLGYVDIVNTFQFMQLRDELKTPADPFVARSRPNGTLLRGAGVLQHNEEPEGRFWMNTTRLHTSISGGVVAALSWSFGKRESESTLADVRLPFPPETTITNLSADLSWQGSPRSQFAVRYRREGVDLSAPPSVIRIGGAIDTVNGDEIPTPPPVDYVRESLVGTAIWHPFTRTTLKSEYRGEFTHREGDGGSWLGSFASTTHHNEEKHRGSVSLQLTPVRTLRLRGEYAVTGTVHPLYPTTPDSRNEGILSLAFDPKPTVGFLLDLRSARESADPAGEYRRGFDRRVDSAELSAAVSPVETLTLSASLSWQRDRTAGDLTASAGGGSLFPFPSSHLMLSRVHAVKGVWRVDPDATLSLAYTRTAGEIGFSTADIPTTVYGVPGSSGGVGSLAPSRVVEQQITSALDVAFTKNVSGHLAWEFARLSDRLDQSYEGYAHLLTAMVSCRW